MKQTKKNGIWASRFVNEYRPDDLNLSLLRPKNHVSDARTWWEKIFLFAAIKTGILLKINRIGRAKGKRSEDASWPDSQPTIFLKATILKSCKEHMLKRGPIARDKEQIL